MAKKLLFIYNAHAGKEQIKLKLAEIIDLFVKNGYEVTTHPTQKFRDAYYRAQKFEPGYDLLVCSGGDGTLDEVVSGMMLREDRIPVGYIPTGTTNDFANSLHISRNVLEAAEVAVEGAAFPCDVGRFNKGIFVYVAAFGIFTDVSYQTKQEMKNVFGHIAYILEGIKRLYAIKYYKMKVTYDEGVVEDEFIYGMVTNSRSVGGFKNLAGKDIIFDDGLFEVTLIKKPKNPIELQEIIAALLIESFDSKYMYTFKTSRVAFEADEDVSWALDGEFGGIHRNAVIKNDKQALEIMVDPEIIPRLRGENVETLEKINE